MTYFEEFKKANSSGEPLYFFYYSMVVSFNIFFKYLCVQPCKEIHTGLEKLESNS